MIFPASPFLSNWNPISNSPKSIECVSTGAIESPWLIRNRWLWYQVSNIRRPFTPMILAALKITSLLQSIASGSDGIPRSTAVPAPRRLLSPSRNPSGWPDISSITSTPFTSISRFTTSLILDVTGLITRSAPSVFASAALKAFGSATAIVCAPIDRAIGIAKSPIAPAPTISTERPATLSEVTVCMALPSGSKIAACSSGMRSSTGHTFVCGMTRYSAKHPSQSTPMIFTFWQICPCPVRQYWQCPHTRCPSALTRCPSFSPSTPSPTESTRPTNSCPVIRGGLIRPWLHLSQL